MFYEKIYEKLSELIDFDSLLKNQYLKYSSSGFMDLNIDFLRFEGKNSFIFAMAHNFTLNGDVMAHPDMEIRISPKDQIAEALTFQLDCEGIYQQVYKDNKIDTKLKNKLNTFLDKWLTYIKLQNYKLSIDCEELELK